MTVAPGARRLFLDLGGHRSRCFTAAGQHILWDIFGPYGTALFTLDLPNGSIPLGAPPPPPTTPPQASPSPSPSPAPQAIGDPVAAFREDS